jgi:hypothetical protein
LSVDFLGRQPIPASNALGYWAFGRLDHNLSKNGGERQRDDSVTSACGAKDQGADAATRMTLRVYARAPFTASGKKFVMGAPTRGPWARPWRCPVTTPITRWTRNLMSSRSPLRHRALTDPAAAEDRHHKLPRCLLLLDATCHLSRIGCAGMGRPSAGSRLDCEHDHCDGHCHTGFDRSVARPSHGRSFMPIASLQWELVLGFTYSFARRSRFAQSARGSTAAPFLSDGLRALVRSLRAPARQAPHRVGLPAPLPSHLCGDNVNYLATGVIPGSAGRLPGPDQRNSW